MRVEMPYKVYFQSPHAAVTRSRGGSEHQTTSRHFATKEEAIKFCGDPRRVLYRPGEAHKNVESL
jgi:hypothetical protein